MHLRGGDEHAMSKCGLIRTMVSSALAIIPTMYITLQVANKSMGAQCYKTAWVTQEQKADWWLRTKQASPTLQRLRQLNTKSRESDQTAFGRRAIGTMAEKTVLYMRERERERERKMERRDMAVSYDATNSNLASPQDWLLLLCAACGLVHFCTLINLLQWRVIRRDILCSRTNYAYFN